MKYTPDKVKFAKHNMFDMTSWLKIRNKPKDLKCSNCGTEYPQLNDKGIGVIELQDSRIVHVCNACVDYFITNGVIDLFEIEQQALAQKQAIASVLRSDFGYKDKDINLTYSVDWFETRLQQEKKAAVEREERANRVFAGLPDPAQKALLYISEITKHSLVEIFLDDGCVFDIFGNFDIVYEEWDSRWIRNLLVGGKIGDKFYRWEWADVIGDASLSETGWEFEFETLEEIQPWETISDTNILDWLETTKESNVLTGKPDNMTVREYLKRKVFANG